MSVARNILETQECSFVLSEMEFNIRVEGRSRFRTFENISRCVLMVDNNNSKTEHYTTTTRLNKIRYVLIGTYAHCLSCVTTGYHENIMFHE